MDSMFKPLTDKAKAERKLVQKAKKNDIAIFPVPDETELSIPLHQLGTPAYIWDYRDSQGKLLFRNCRFIIKQDNHSVRKEDRPLSLRKNDQGKIYWDWKGLEKPRPIYGLDRLSTKPDAAVIICEGEKATDAAASLFPDYVTITSPNGAGSAHNANWEPLSGRTIFIWPDNDSDGKNYASSVARLTKNIGASSVSIVQIPEDFPAKWDLADTLPDGWSNADISGLLEKAVPVLDPLDNLVKRCSENIGEAYKSEVLAALSALKKQDLPQYMDLRDKLKRAGIGITNLDNALLEYSKEFGDEQDNPDHLDYAREVISMIGDENILSTDSHVWKWDNQGVWVTLSERAAKQEVQTILADQPNVNITRGLIDAVTDVFKTEIYASDHEWNKKLSIVNLRNGELSWHGDSWILSPHCRENYCTTQIPVHYDPTANCPRFSRFLEEIFQPDTDGIQKSQALLEMIGYSLMSDARYERFVLLVGNGANGKSVLMEIVKALLGMKNVSAVQPSQFGNKFQRAHMHMKLANLVTEIPEGAEIADAELKAIVSGELTTAEHKNQNPFDFCPFATCWFGTNHMPHTRDFSDALFRRAIVIPFNRKFILGVDADPNLKISLLEELPGILNLALNAFGNVIRSGSFTEPDSCKKAKQDWRLEADQVAQFVAEKCFADQSSSIASSELYHEYQLWADDAGISKKLGRKNFSTRLVRLGYALGKGSGGTRMIDGIRIGWKKEE